MFRIGDIVTKCIGNATKNSTYLDVIKNMDEYNVTVTQEDGDILIRLRRRDKKKKVVIVKNTAHIMRR